MQNEQYQLLADGLTQLCCNDPDSAQLLVPRMEEIQALLVRYSAEILRCNPALSLVGTDDPQELILRHILDSLAPLGILYRTGNTRRIADVGSGAGLPGIPLAIALPQSQLTLIERKGRRAGFLQSTCAALGLSNIAVEEAEMEKVPPGRFSMVTFRAFRPLEMKLIKKLFRLCGDGGCLAAYKGRSSKAEAEITALEEAGFSGQWELLPCPVPMLNEERHLLVITQVLKNSSR